MSQRCKSCNAPVIWVRMAASGRPAPLDATPVLQGNIIIRDGQGHVVDATYPSEARHLSHFATCPQAASWRARKDA